MPSPRLLYQDLCRSSPELGGELDAITKEALVLWQNQNLRTFTAHGADHILQVESNLDSLTSQLQKFQERLTPEEIFILLAACYLHDIGMQLGERDARENHAQYAFDLILNSYASHHGEERRVTLPIHDRNARQAIAGVARGHWTSFALELPSDDVIHGNTRGRLRLLGLLLATADLLDLSPVRATHFRSIHLLDQLDSVAELHQVKHESVKGFRIVSPDPRIPEALQYQLEWADDGPTTRMISEWELHWFSSQYEVVSGPLHSESGGRIRWHEPWISVTFRPPVGPPILLSESARRILEEELGKHAGKKNGAGNGAAASKSPPGKAGSHLRTSFSPPEFRDAAHRTALSEELLALLRSHPACGVGGISGSGKSNLVATSVRRLINEGVYADILWHDTLPDEPLDSLFSKLDPQTQSPGWSATEKARQLIATLEEQNLLLVIDDFHQVETSSYQVLVNAATRIAAPARLLLVSQSNHAMQGPMPAMPYLAVPGLTVSELDSFLRSKGGRKLAEPVLEDLRAKTEGLPVAIDFFLSLVELGSSPESLLKGNMLVRDRIRKWFQEVELLGGGEQSKLLNLLAICEGPFNMGIVLKLGRYAAIGCTEDIFEALQRRYLVQEYSPFRWKLHQIVKLLCTVGQSETEKRATHAVLGKYFLSTSRRIAKQYAPERTFSWQLQACTHLQSAGEFQLLCRNLRNMAKHIKHRGYYDLFIHLVGSIPEFERSSDKWLVYHHAHCSLIVGKPRSCLRLIEGLTYDSDQEPALRISFTRLYAEAHQALGNPAEALVRLREVTATSLASEVPAAVAHHLRTVELHVLIELNELEEAERKCEQLLGEGDSNPRGQAVVLTNWGIVCSLTGRFQLGEQKLKQAAELFKRCNDNRGFAWSAAYHAYCLFECGKVDRANRLLSEALRIKNEIREASREYHAFLTKMAGRFKAKIVKAAKLSNY